MRKAHAACIAALVLVLVFASFSASDCPFINAVVVPNATVEKGVDAVYAIALTNYGWSLELVKLSGVCPEDLNCFFEPTPAYANIAPSQTIVFNLVVKTSQAKTRSYSIPMEITLGTQTTPCDVRYLTLLVKPPAPTASPPPFTVSLDPSGNVSARPGETLEFKITIANNYDMKGYARFKLVGAFSDSTTFSATDVDLAPFESKEIVAKLRVPPGTPGMAYDSVFQVEATQGGTCCEFSYQLPIRLLCVYAPVLDVTLINQPIACTPTRHDEETILEMALKNNGEIEGPFKLFIEASDAAKKIASVSPELLSIESGDRQDVFVSIKPTRATVLDVYYYNLVLKYLDFTVFQKPLCFTVSAVTNFFVTKEEEYVVPRCIVTIVPITVTNNGTISDRYAIEVTPPPSMLVQPVPSSFTLAPNEAKRVDLVVSTSLERTPLGSTLLPIIVRSTRVSQLINLNLLIVSSNRTGESFLSIQQKAFTASPGVPMQEFVNVSNSKKEKLHGVALSIKGVPSSWYRIFPPSKDVEAKQSISYTIDFSVPEGAALGRYPLELTAASQEGESVKLNSSLEVVKAVGSMDLGVYDAQYFSDEKTREIIVFVSVRNTGTAFLKGVRPVLEGFSVASQPSSLSLAPGETQLMLVSVTTPAVLPQDKTLPLRLEASDGTQSNTINVVASPPSKPARTSTWIFVAVLALIALVVGVFLFVKREAEAEFKATLGAEKIAEAEEERLKELAEKPLALAGVEPKPRKKAKKKARKEKK